MTDIATLQVTVTSKGIQAAKRELDQLAKTAGLTETKTDRLRNSSNKLSKSAAGIGTAFRVATVAIAGLGLGKAASSIAAATDRMAGMQGQIKLVTSSQEEQNAVYQRALTLSNQTGAAVESTVNLYARLARSTEELNLSQDSLFTITKAVNQSFVVSGASAQESSSAILQLSQGLAAGALRGEELNSVMENSPRLARALADGLGVSIGQLRVLGQEGELTAEKVTGALMKMADEINGDFQQMPMTIGRIVQEMRNDFLDAFGSVNTGPLIEGMRELSAVVSDPAFKDGLQAIGGAMLNVAAAGAKLLAMTGNLRTAFHNPEVAEMAGDIDALNSELAKYQSRLEKAQPWPWRSADVERYQQKIKEINAAILQHEGFLGGSSAAFKVYQDVVGQVIPQQKNYQGILNSTVSGQKIFSGVLLSSANNAEQFAKGSDNLTTSTKALEKSFEALQKRHERANDSLTKGIEALDDMVRQSDAYADALEFEVSLLGQTELAQARARAQRDLGTRSTAEQRDRVDAATVALFEHNQALEAAKTATEAAAQAQKPFQDALQGTIERIDGAFADAWQGAFDSFGDFKDSLVNAFQSMLAEMAHLAITRPIVMSFAGAAGGALGIDGLTGMVQGGGFGGGAAGGATGGIGGISSAISGIGSMLSGGITSLGANLTTTLSSMGLGETVLGLQKAGAALLPGAQGTTQVLAGGALSAGAGIVGGLAGNAVFGETSGLGATGGAMVGTLLGGPVGAAIGGFVGSGIEKGLGNVFGFGQNNGNNSGRASFDLATGEMTAAGVGKSFDQANVEQVANAAAQIANFAQQIGGSTFAAEFEVGNRSGIQVTGGPNFGTDEDAFNSYAFREVIKNATNLSDTVIDMALAFEGSASDLAEYTVTMQAVDTVTAGLSDKLRNFAFSAEGTQQELVVLGESLASLDALTSMNGVAESVANFNRVQYSALDTYTYQTAGLQRLIQTFDGSASSAATLSQEFARNKEMAIAYANAIQVAGAAMGVATEDQARYFRESAMSAEALRAARLEERNSLAASLEAMTDPAELETAFSRIQQLNKTLFDSLAPEDRNAEAAEEYATFIEDAYSTVQGKFADRLTELQENEDNLNMRYALRMEAIASQEKATADQNQQTAALQAQTVNRLGEIVTNFGASLLFDRNEFDL